MGWRHRYAEREIAMRDLDDGAQLRVRKLP
jgi:hypothetical protein